ncbi:MAG: protein kinase [Bacteroides sp.]|nr:protein kinase [Bacteroides sp.]
MKKEEEMPVSLIMDEHEDALDCGVELLCQRPSRMLWIAVRDGRRVVYKGLPENMRGRIEETSALRKEYLLGLKVDNEGVVRYYGFEQHPMLGPVIVMEYVDGIGLNLFLNPNANNNLDTPDLPRRQKIALGIAMAISALHHAGVAHRDLKPDNILIRSKDDCPKIIDFSHGDSDDFVMYKKSLATDIYGAPEQQVPSEGGKASDIYSFGRILDMLLPEPRFKRLRESCKAAEAADRPDIDKVVRQLGVSSTSTRRRVIVALVALVIIIGGCGFLYSETGQKANSPLKDKELAAVGDESKAEESADINQSAEWRTDSETPVSQTSLSNPSGDEQSKQPLLNNPESGNGQSALSSTPPPPLEYPVPPAELIKEEKKLKESNAELYEFYCKSRDSFISYNNEFAKKLKNSNLTGAKYNEYKFTLESERDDEFHKIDQQFVSKIVDNTVAGKYSQELGQQAYRLLINVMCNDIVRVQKMLDQK